MDKHEKVIKALGYRTEFRGACGGDICPYYNCRGCLDALMKDALEPLKEDEAQMPDKEDLERMLQNRDDMPMDFEPMDFYDSPVHLITKEISCAIDDGVYKAVVSAGINVDKEKLIQIIQGDRERYEEAYRKGWNDCLHKVMEVAQR